VKTAALKSEGRPLRFLIAGALNTAFGLGLYPLLLFVFPLFQTHYMVGLLIAQAICLCFAFMTYKIGVFRSRGNLAREFAAFSTYYLFNYAVNWGALPLLVEAGGLSPTLAQFGFSLLLMIGSWFWHSRITFKQGI